LLGGGATYPRLGDYVLAFFDSPTLQSDVAIGMGAGHPLCISAATKRERMIGRVSTNPGFFTQGGNNGGPIPYFEQYAVHVIPTQCRAGHLGFVVFTTTQAEDMAEDALETLGLIASVTSSFHSRWYDCQHARQLLSENSDLRTQLYAAGQQHRAAGVVPGAPAPAAVQAAAGVGAA
jgi:hypothetical protein